MLVMDDGYFTSQGTSSHYLPPLNLCCKKQQMQCSTVIAS